MFTELAQQSLDPDDTISEWHVTYPLTQRYAPI